MLSAEPPTALDAGRAAVHKEEEEGEEVTPHAPLLRTLEGANTNPCFVSFWGELRRFRVIKHVGTFTCTRKNK